MIRYNDNARLRGAVKFVTEDMNKGREHTNRLLHRIQSRLYQYERVHRYADADDIMQEFFYKLIRDEYRNGEREFPNEKSRMAFLTKVLDSAIIRYFQKQKSRKEKQDKNEGILDQTVTDCAPVSKKLEIEDIAERIYTEMGRLSVTASASLLMSSQGVSYSEISSLLGIPRMTLLQQARRGRKKIFESLASKCA